MTTPRRCLFVRFVPTFSALSLALPAFAGFNAAAPKGVRRIFTQIAFAEGRLVTYHVLEPGPQAIQAFPTSPATGMLLRFPNCPGLRPVLDDSAAPSASSSTLVPDRAMREVFNVVLSRCDVQPSSADQALGLALSRQSIGFVNAPGVPAPMGAAVPLNEQQTADELWGPVPNVGVVDHFAGPNLSPQHTQGTLVGGLPAAISQQPEVRRPRDNNGIFADAELVRFADVDWDGDGLPDDGVLDPDSTFE